MTEKRLAVTVDKNASMVADLGYVCDVPHPRGYVLSAALRMSRAIYMYEWAKANLVEKDGWVTFPSANHVQDIIHEWEETER